MTRAVYSLPFILPFIAGLAACFQGVINGYWQARIGLHSTVLINGAVVTAVAGLFFFFGNQTPLGVVSSQVRPWVVLNGLCGFTIVAIAAFSFPRIGAASVVVLMVAGQIVTSLVVDHLGLLNLPGHPISSSRICGAALVVLGVALTTRS